jgi:hypothetical protein
MKGKGNRYYYYNGGAGRGKWEKLGEIWLVLVRFGSFSFVFGAFWVCFFCVFLVNSHCNSLSFQVLQVVGSAGNWVCFA